MGINDANAPLPRIASGSIRQVGPAVWLFAQIAGRTIGTEPPNLFLTLGRQRKLFWGWLHFAGRLMPGGRLGRRESEIVILRVAHLRSSEYELSHHVRLGRRAGLTGAEIDRVFEQPAADAWTPRERAILAAVDCLHQTQDLDDAAWSELRRHLDEEEAIEFCQLVGHYEMLATTLRALRVPVDQPARRVIGRSR